MNTKKWAEFIFGQADLGDTRRTKRLTLLANDMASNTGCSIVKSCDSPAKIEAAYRFIRNESISPQSIAESGFKRTCELMKQRSLVLAIQDTTGLTYKHSVCEDLGDVSCANTQKKVSKTRTLYAHSTLILDADTEQVVGLADQQYWYRQTKVQGTGNEQQRRPAKEKESYRWQKATKNIQERTNDLSNVIEVCDREADTYEYMDFQVSQSKRFLVRAKENRKLSHPKCNVIQLRSTVCEQCKYIVNVQQKGGRKSRQAKLSLSYQSITLARPRFALGSPELKLNIIICQEKDSEQESPLCWTLYTTEPINSVEDAKTLVRYYELRWRIEEFHKVWKSDGTEVEELRLQHCENIKRIAIIKAFIAVRLMQLQEMVKNKASAEQICCTTYVTDLTWKLLWRKVEKGKELPKIPPSLHWFYYATARLSGWYDSKRNGRVGVKAIWQGWLKLAEMVESAELAISLQQIP